MFAGLPDLSWFNKSKREKIPNYKENIPNGYEIYQMAVK
jgi:arginine utilization protein RocB